MITFTVFVCLIFCCLSGSLSQIHSYPQHVRQHQQLNDQNVEEKLIAALIHDNRDELSSRGLYPDTDYDGRTYHNAGQNSFNKNSFFDDDEQDDEQEDEQRERNVVNHDNNNNNNNNKNVLSSMQIEYNLFRRLEPATKIRLLTFLLEDMKESDVEEIADEIASLAASSSSSLPTSRQRQQQLRVSTAAKNLREKKASRYLTGHRGQGGDLKKRMRGADRKRPGWELAYGRR